MGSYQLRDYQRAAVDAGLAYLTDSKLAGRHGIIVQPTGGGKSLVAANLVLALNGPCVVFQPSKEILEQNAAKLASYGYRAAIFSASMGRREIGKITLATIGSVVRYPEAFRDMQYVLIDECFPAGTLIDGRPIQDIRVGDFVASWNEYHETVEPRLITGVFEKRVRNLVRVTFGSGRQLVCTPDHPVMTVEGGYVPASELLGLSALIYNSINASEGSWLPGLWRKVCQARWWPSVVEILQSQVCARASQGEPPERRGDVPMVRQSHCADGISAEELSTDRPGVLFDGMRLCGSERCRQASTQNASATYDQSAGRLRSERRWPSAIIAADANEQSYVGSDYSRTSLEDTSVHGSSATDTGWQRQTSSGSTATVTRRTRFSVEGGASDRDEAPAGWLSALLQNRHRERAVKDRCRSRRPWSWLRAGARARPSQGRVLEIDRVDSVEILQRGSDGTFGGLCPNGLVYDLEVEHNHNFFACGVLVHNCHQALSPKGGQYLDFLSALPDARICGLTATPFRLASNSLGSELRFLTRTRPRIFRDVVHVTQIQDLVRDGYWCPLTYEEVPVVPRERLRVNSTGADYTDASVQQVFAEVGFVGRLCDEVQRQLDDGRRHVLVFTRFVDEARKLAQAIPGAAYVTAETPSEERAQIIRDFGAGRIRVCANVAVLGLGFDFPELDCVIQGRPSISLSIHYQQIGRCVRPHPSKPLAHVVDLVGLVKQFGKVEDLVIRPGGFRGEQWTVCSGTRALTNCYFAQRDDVDPKAVAKAQKNRSYWAKRKGGQRWRRA